MYSPFNRIIGPVVARSALAVVGLSCLAVVGCSQDDRAAADVRVTDRTRPLVVLTHPTDPPCSYLDENGNCVGTDVDLARKIAARMGRKLIVKPVEFESIIPQLKEGCADLGIATITITDARRRDVDFSAPYAFGGSCFLYRKDGPRPRLSQAASLRIGAEAGTTGDLYLCIHGCDPVRFVDMTDAIAALDKGDVDAIFFDAIPVADWARKSGGRLVASSLLTRESYGIAVDKRRPDVLAAANAVIAEERGLK